MENNPTSVRTWLLGGTIEGVGAGIICKFWIVSGGAVI